MAEFFSILWTVLSFIFGILWSIVWFILSDLLSTLAWIGIFVWLGFVLRYRSFGLGTLAVMRYGRYALKWLWRWVRKSPSDGPIPIPAMETKIVREYRHRVPFGHASVSEEMNVLLVFLIILMANV